MTIIRQNTCATCAYKVREGGEVYCRLNPPVSHPVIGMTPKGPQVAAMVTAFPKVNDEWWCGQWSQSSFAAPIEIGQRPIGNA